MNPSFERKVQAAAVAAWWVALLVVALVLLQWFAYLGVMRSQPQWVMPLWGPNIEWPFIQMVWFWGIAVMKFILWLIVLVALWLTLWARQLRKMPGGS